MRIHKNYFMCLVTAIVTMLIMFTSFSVFASVSPKRISIAYSKDSVPFHFSDETGQPAGIIIDLWRLWSEKTGIAIDFHAADWNESLAMVGSGTIDVHAGLFFNKERDKFLDYGAVLTKTDTHYFSHRTLPQINGIDGLAAYRVGVLADDFVEGYLKERLPKGTVLPFPDYDSIMKALQDGTLKVFAADTPTGLFYLNKNGLLPEFTFVSEKPLYQNDWFVAVQEGNKALIEVINQGMALITDEEKRDINRHWIASGEQKGKAVIIAINRAYAPLTFVNALGRPSGLFIDMWRAWAQKNGRKIQFRASNWAESLEGLRTGEVDIHSGLSFSKKRAEWIDFSTQIYETFGRIYHRVDDIQPEAIEGYSAFVVGTWFDTFQEAEFRTTYPTVNIRSFGTNQELIQALVKGEVKAVIQEEQLMETALDRLGLRGDITARSEKLFPSTIHAGVLKGNSELLKQINNGFSAIPHEKLADFEKRWIPNPKNHFYKSATTSIVLSPEEKSWLNDHPVIRVGVDPTYPPFEFVSEQGNYNGIIPDYLKLVSERLGIKFKPIHGLTWEQVLAGTKDGTIDILPGLNDTAERRKFLTFTKTYLSAPMVIFTRTDFPSISGLADLTDKSIAIPSGYSDIEMVKNNFPSIKIVEVKSLIDALTAVATGEVESTLGNLAVGSYLIQKHHLVNLKVAASSKSGGSKLAMGVRKDYPELARILDKVLDSITQEEHQKIQSTWCTTTKIKIKLTHEEKCWLAHNQKIRLGIDTAWAPFEFIDENGKYSGLSSGYVEAVTDRIQVEMTPVQNLNWLQVIDMAKAGKIDVLPATAYSKDREKYLSFTKSYVSLPIIIAVQKDLPYVNGLTDLVGYRVGVVESYMMSENLARDYSQLKITKFSTLKEGLKNLEKGKIDAFVDTLSAITHEITQSKFNNIKISAPTEYKYDLAFGVRKDWPELVNILNKVIDDISDKERMRIKNTWMAPVEVKYGIDLKKIMIWVIPIGISFVLIFLFVGIWNRRLAVEVKERKEAEDRLKLTQNTVDKAAQSIFWVDPETSGFTYVNEAACESLCYTKDELLGMSVPDIDVEFSVEKMEGLIQFLQENPQAEVEGVHRTKDGRLLNVMLSIVLTQYQSRQIIGIYAKDITARKMAELALHKNEAKYRELVENANSIIIKLDPEGRVVFFNEYAQNFFGYTSQEVLGNSIVDSIVPEEDAKGVDMKQFILDIVKSPLEYEKNENENIRKNGKRVWISWTNKAIFDTERQELLELLCIGTDITERKQFETAIKESHKKITDSIKFASMIQNAMLPEERLLSNFCEDAFVLWEPKDVVGGDIFFIEQLKDKNELILFVIDCTGHGVPGALVTAIVKAVQLQAMVEILMDEKEISPARLLSYFNVKMKDILKQQDKNASSNAGFDGGVLYINKKERIVKFSGAETPLFYIQNKKIKMIKGDRHSVGYKTSDADHQFKDHTIAMDRETWLYMTTDGFLDQNGGEKGYPFGKKKFKQMLLDNYQKSFDQQKMIYLDTIDQYRDKEEKTDDMTFVGLKIG